MQLTYVFFLKYHLNYVGTYICSSYICQGLKEWREAIWPRYRNDTSIYVPQLTTFESQVIIQDYTPYILIGPHVNLHLEHGSLLNNYFGGSLLIQVVQNYEYNDR